MPKAFDVVQPAAIRRDAEIIRSLANHPEWKPFLDWLYRRATATTITNTNPNPLIALVQQAKLEVLRDIENALREPNPEPTTKR